jgi:hypothetical protein
MGGLKGARRPRRERTYPAGLRIRLRSAEDVARHVGVRAFAGRVLPWSICRDYFLFSQDLDRIVPCPPPDVPYSMRPAGKGDIPALMALRKGYYSRPLLEKRFGDGHMAFLGWSGEEPVSCHWALVGSIEVPYLHGRLVLGPGEVYTDEIFVRPESRKSGIYAYGSFLIRTAIRAKGFRTMYCAVASWNEVPREIMIRSGMTEIARLRCRNVPGFVKVRWSGRVDVHEDGSFAFHGAR